MTTHRTDSGLLLHAAGLTLALALTGLAALGIVQPVMAERERSSGVLSQLEDARARTDALRLERRKLDQKLAQLTGTLATQRVVPVPVSHQNQRLAALTDLAQRQGLILEQMTPGATTTTERSTAVSIRMACRGTYPACVAFLKNLHAEYPDTAVVGIRAMAPPGEVEAGAYIGLDLIWYAAPSSR
jgi:hypothetical protein